MIALNTDFGDDNPSPSFKLRLINQTLKQLNSVSDVLFSLRADLEPTNPTYLKFTKQIMSISQMSISVQYQKNILQTFINQVTDEVKKQGLTVVDYPKEQQMKSKIDVLQQLIAQQEPESPYYNYLMSQFKALYKDHTVMKNQANPEVEKLVKDISLKNKAAIENGTFDTRPMRVFEIRNDSGRLRTLMADLDPRSNAYLALEEKIKMLDKELMSLSLQMDTDRDPTRDPKAYQAELEGMLADSDPKGGTYLALKEELDRLTTTTPNVELKYL